MPSSQSKIPRDYCKGLRKTYTAVIRFLSTNTPLALLLSGLPATYLILFSAVYYSRNPYAPLSGAATSYCVCLTLIWLLATVAVWKTAPNALTVAIYLNRAIGNWAAISFLLLISYGFSVIPVSYTSILFVTLAPLVLTLHLTADIQRTVRERLYAALEPPKLSPPEQPTGAPKIVIHQ
jgi:hypothetical protein